jgi:hypothetical protein
MQKRGQEKLQRLEKHGIRVRHVQFPSTCNFWSNIPDVCFSVSLAQGFNIFDKFATVKLALGTYAMFYLKQCLQSRSI